MFSASFNQYRQSDSAMSQIKLCRMDRTILQNKNYGKTMLDEKTKKFFN